MWIVLNEWDRINTDIKAFVSNGLFVTSWRTFLSYECVKGGEEYLRLDECRLKMMSVSLGRANHQQKWQTNPKVSEGVAVPLWAEVLLLL